MGTCSWIQWVTNHIPQAQHKSGVGSIISFTVALFCNLEGIVVVLLLIDKFTSLSFFDEYLFSLSFCTCAHARGLKWKYIDFYIYADNNVS